ncbi:MAG TPA: NAD(P)-binding domain-containing protein [Solirubrobacterales bacterium]|nr:NAD(P)-binding domain-containing protein [Solirubrobacterales bacterium]
MSIGTIGAGEVAQTIARRAIDSGHHVILSNSRGPESLTDIVAQLGAGASAGTVAEAAGADIVLLAVKWDQVPEAVRGVSDWSGRIVIDATNQWDFVRDAPLDLGDQTGTERNAALMPGARVVKAFNTLNARVIAQNPSSRLVVFLAGHDADAKSTVSTFVDSMEFAPVDIGGVREGRLMQFATGPLNSFHLMKIA